MSPAEQIAKWFHTEYERRAPHLGYKTREESAVPWEEVPEVNRNLMVAVVSSLLEQGVIQQGTQVTDPEATDKRDTFERLVTQANEAWARMREDPEVWDAELRERAEWDGTLADGLEDEDL